MADLIEMRRAAMAALRPPAKLRLSEWIEREMRLPDDVSSTPGPVRLWEFQREIADAIGDPVIPRVSCLKAVRCGYSTLLVAAVAAYASNDPCPVICLVPTEADARNFVVHHLEPVAGVTPALSGVFSDDGGDRNTILQKRYPGGSLKVIAARAPRNLRAHTARVLLCDEIDAMEVTAEGNPVLLGEKRTLSYVNRKIVVGSTPTVAETSLILKAYALSDQRIFEVECPECRDHAEILWKDIRWNAGDPDSAAWGCPLCRCVIPEARKQGMLSAGRWRALRPDVIGHAGFKLSALISLMPNASWPNLVREFLAAKGDPDSLRVFVNTILAEPWRDGGDELDESDLAGRAEPFGLTSIPREVLYITAGIDMQDDRAEWALIGHTRTEALILAHGAIWGRYDSPDLWQEVEDLLRQNWQHPLGGRIGVSSALIDEGDGEHQPHVRAYTRGRFGRRIASCKGVAGFTRAPLERSQAKGATMFIIGVDGLKNALFNKLAAGAGIRFSADLSPRFYEELTSERRAIRYTRGQPSRYFERVPGKRAECLDTTVYAMAARLMISGDMDRRAEELSSAAAPKAAPAVIKSAWLG